MHATTKNELVDLYRRRARNYDLTASLYYLIGFRQWAYRRRAVEALELEPADTVVEIGCGTGLNLGLYQSRIAITAPFGVSLELAERHPWESVECYLPGSCVSELYFGFSYLAVGQAASDKAATSVPFSGPPVATPATREGVSDYSMATVAGA
jgi:hypothetical protein